jgi:hypothetical protein
MGIIADYEHHFFIQFMYVGVCTLVAVPLTVPQPWLIMEDAYVTSTENSSVLSLIVNVCNCGLDLLQ